jgi:hypothetical protein
LEVDVVLTGEGFHLLHGGEGPVGVEALLGGRVVALQEDPFAPLVNRGLQ